MWRLFLNTPESCEIIVCDRRVSRRWGADQLSPPGSTAAQMRICVYRRTAPGPELSVSDASYDQFKSGKYAEEPSNDTVYLPRTPRNPLRPGVQRLGAAYYQSRIFLWQSNIRGNWVEAPVEGESGALNESHMFPKMEAFQAAWALWAGGSGAPPALLAHTGLCTVHTAPFSAASPSRGPVYVCGGA